VLQCGSSADAKSKSSSELTFKTIHSQQYQRCAVGCKGGEERPEQKREEQEREKQEREEEASFVMSQVCGRGQPWP